MWPALARHRYRRLSLTGSTPCRARAQCVACVSTSSISSLVIDGFDTLPRSMSGLRSHVIAVITCICPVSSPVASTIAAWNVHTDSPRIGPAIARDVGSVLPCHRYRRLLLTCSTLCRACAPCLVCEHVIAIVACHWRVRNPAALDARSSFARRRFHRMPLSGVRPCRY